MKTLTQLERNNLWEFAGRIIKSIKAAKAVNIDIDERQWSDIEGEWFDALEELYTSQFREPSTEQSGGTEQEEKILESHFGSDFYQLKEHRFLPHIISAMKEHAGIVAEQAFLAGRSKTSWSQFKKDMNHTRKP